MKRVLALVSSLLCVAILAPAARADLRVRWHVSLPGGVQAVAVGPDGSVYTVGTRGIPEKKYGSQVTVRRLNGAGTVVWTRRWHPRGGASWGSAVTVSPDGIVFVAGTVGVNSKGASWFVRSYGPNGGLRAAFVAPYEVDVMSSVTDVVARGDLVVVAQTAEGCCEAWPVDGWVRAFDARLRPRWSDTFIRHRGDPVTGLSLDAFGNVLVGGIEGTRFSGPSSPPVAGVLAVEKLTAGGALLWRHRPGVKTPGDGTVAVSALGDRLMVSAPLRAGGAWLGRFTLGGDLRWSRAWGTERRRRQTPLALAIDASGATWVVGTRRHATDPQVDGSVRRIGPAGGLLGTISIANAGATGVSPWRGDAYVAATDLWRIAG
ncbi:MAG: hypothetical protein ACM3OO_11910 [Planctomycetaceae bacterium]